MIYRLAAIVSCLFLITVECKKKTGICSIDQRFQGKFTIRHTETGKLLGNIAVESTKLRIIYNNKPYSYVCKEANPRSVILFETTDSTKPPNVLCLQFSHIADHPFARFVLRRYSGFPPMRNDFFSPIVKSTESIKCQLADPHNPADVYLL